MKLIKDKYRKIILFSFIVLLFIGQVVYIPSLGNNSYWHLDKIYHFLTATILVLMFYFARYSLTKSVLAALLIGGLGEIIQIPIPYRSASLADFSVEAIGIILVALFLSSS